MPNGTENLNSHAEPPASSNATPGYGSSEIEQTKKDVEFLKADISGFKDRIVEIMAIFVALFTFVSVDIQIFKSDISFLSATGTSLITLGALILFVCILHFIQNKPDYNFKKRWLIFLYFS